MKLNVTIGDVFVNNSGKKATVVGIENYLNITVQFSESGYVGTYQLGSLRRGVFKDFIYGVGFNTRRHRTREDDGKVSRSYDCWRRMLFRSSQGWWNKHPSYVGTTVCEEWQDFSNFADWYNSNCTEPLWDLDKDLLYVGSKLYSPETCCFLPENINKAIVIAQNQKSYHFKWGRYEAYIKGKYIGGFDTKEEAQAAYIVKKCQDVSALASTTGLSDMAQAALLNFKLEVVNGFIKRTK